MKTKLLQLVSITLLLLFSANVFAQPDGTLTFTFNRGPAPYTGLTAFDVPATVPLTYNNTSSNMSSLSSFNHHSYKDIIASAKKNNLNSSSELSVPSQVNSQRQPKFAHDAG